MALTKLYIQHVYKTQKCHLKEAKTIQQSRPPNHYSDFNLSGGCFGTEIIQNCTKWSNIEVHGLRLGPIEAEFQGASSSIQKNAEK